MTVHTVTKLKWRWATIGSAVTLAFSLITVTVALATDRANVIKDVAKSISMATENRMEIEKIKDEIRTISKTTTESAVDVKWLRMRFDPNYKLEKP